MAAPRPCLARLARALGGGVSLAVFHGNPFDPDERAICENWTFTVPQRHFGAPRFDDAVALLAGRWRAIGYLNEHPVYVHDDAASALYYNEYKEEWQVISIADENLGTLARAKKKSEEDEAPPKNGWIVACISDDMITAGVRFDIVKEQKAQAHQDAQEDQAHVDDTERPPKRQRDAEKRESLWQQKDEEPRLPASAQSFQEPRLSASAQSVQDWATLKATAKQGPPSRPAIGMQPAIGARPVPQAPTLRGPRPPSMPPWSHQHRQVRRASPPQRGGWFTKAQRLCNAILDRDFRTATDLADKWYCGPPPPGPRSRMLLKNTIASSLNNLFR